MAPPTSTASPITVGLVRTSAASGKPKAHFNSRFGTSSALRPAISAVWYPVARRLPPHPIDDTAPRSGSDHPRSAQKADSGSISRVYARPVRYSASRTRCSGVRSAPSACITPSSSEATIARGDRALSIMTPGVRSSPAAVWQVAQASAKSAASASPSLRSRSCALAEAYETAAARAIKANVADLLEVCMGNHLC